MDGCCIFGKGRAFLGVQLAMQIFLISHYLTSVCFTVVEEVLNFTHDQWQNPCYWVCYALCRL